MNRACAAMLLLALAACSDSYIHPTTVALAAKWCEPHDGLEGVRHTVYSHNMMRVEAACRDGTYIEREVRTP